ncbi:MAG TPA: FAD:protein FMN transferase [Vicinamibacterales bacterium]|nr:FAD:protein FMN transferase [Vicinamibacterales bacterium]
MLGPRRVTRRDFFRTPATGHAPTADFWLRVHRQVMACRFEVVLPGEDSGATPLAREALDYADRLEDLMTIFRDTSELARVNRGAHAGPVVVDPELFAVLAICERVHRATEGAFDITSTPLSRCWGFLQRDGRLPEQSDIDAARADVGMGHVRLDSGHCSVSFDRPGVALNLGAIGKGFALDRLGALLQARGVRRALLSAGSSSILASGGGDDPWPVDLRSAVTNERLATLHLAHGAVGTSGAGEQFVEVDGVRFGHVIDPRSGWPAAGVLSASVVTTDAATADALSTAFLIGGPDLAHQYCSTHPNVLALITPDDGSHRPMTFGSYAGVRTAPA